MSLVDALQDQRGYPRPQLRRAQWHSLNGPWQFARDLAGAWQSPSEVVWDRTIIVPFAPETAASGIGDTGFLRACWYRRQLDIVHPLDQQRVLLHFGAVDYLATIWLNGVEAGHHEGAYTPFTI